MTDLGGSQQTRSIVGVQNCKLAKTFKKMIDLVSRNK